eukprot:jgi/Botrbrau1/21163/Bobra.0061s0056.1
MQSLDEHVLSMILSKLAPRQRLSVSRVCKFWLTSVSSTWTELSLDVRANGMKRLQWLQTYFQRIPGRLKILEIRMSGSENTQVLQVLSCGAFSNLTSLTLRWNGRLPAQTEWSVLPSALPRLQDLQLDGPDCPTIGLEGLHFLRSLQIRGVVPARVLPFPVSLTRMTALQELTLKRLTIAGADTPTLQALAGHLTHMDATWAREGPTLPFQELQSSSLLDLRLRHEAPAFMDDWVRRRPLPRLACPHLTALQTNMRIPPMGHGCPARSLRHVSLSYMRLGDFSNLACLTACTYLSVDFCRNMMFGPRVTVLDFPVIPLPALEELHFRSLVTVDTLILGTGLDTLTSLHTLVIGGALLNYGIGFEFLNVGGTVTQLPSLRELQVHAVRVTNHLLEGPRIQTLELGGSCEHPWCSWPQLGQLPSLSRLAMYHMPAHAGLLPALPAVSTLIIHLGCMEYLDPPSEMHSPRNYELPCNVPALMVRQWLQSCPALRALQLLAPGHRVDMALKDAAHLDVLAIAAKSIQISLMQRPSPSLTGPSMSPPMAAAPSQGATPVAKPGLRQLLEGQAPAGDRGSCAGTVRRPACSETPSCAPHSRASMGCQEGGSSPGSGPGDPETPGREPAGGVTAHGLRPTVPMPRSIDILSISRPSGAAGGLSGLLVSLGAEWVPLQDGRAGSQTETFGSELEGWRLKVGPVHELDLDSVPGDFLEVL